MYVRLKKMAKFVKGNENPNTIAIRPVSMYTSVCERWFSKMSIVRRPLRSTLSKKYNLIAAVHYYSTAGSPLSAWQPYDYVKSWLPKTQTFIFYKLGSMRAATTNPCSRCHQHHHHHHHDGGFV